MYVYIQACLPAVCVCVRSSLVVVVSRFTSIAFFLTNDRKTKRADNKGARKLRFARPFGQRGSMCRRLCVVGGMGEMGWGRWVGFNTQGDWFNMGWLTNGWLCVCVCVCESGESLRYGLAGPSSAGLPACLLDYLTEITTTATNGWMDGLSSRAHSEWMDATSLATIPAGWLAG